MRQLCLIVLSLAFACQWVGTALAKDYKLMEGTVISGTISGPDDNGVIFRLDTGGFSQRYPWSKFTQESLKDMSEDPKIRQYVEPFIELPPKPRPAPKPIILKEAPQVERPVGRLSFFSSAATPLGLTVLALLYIANLFAAYEISIYRNRPLALVCGLSALLPLVGPLIFLSTPTMAPEGMAEGGTGAEAMAEAPPPPPGASAGTAGAATSRKVGTPAPMSGGGLRVAAAAEGKAGGKGEPKIFNRADYTFNRRFIETQFAGFFRIVPSEAEKDLMLVFKTAKQEYVGRRVSRIASNELFLQLQQGGGTKEVSIPFSEITQIQIRHKDDIKP